MSKILFVSHCAKDFLDGTQNMDAMTELAYRRICDMIYSTNDNLLDNDSLQYATKTGSKWKKIRHELIEVHKKIYVENGFLRNVKCSEKLEESRVNLEQKSAAGKASAYARKALKEIETTSTAVGTAVPTAEPTNRKPLTSKEKTTKKESYWWAGEIIRLTKTDYLKLFEKFNGSDDQFMDWLKNRDVWYQSQSPPIQKKWFIATNKALDNLQGDQ